MNTATELAGPASPTDRREAGPESSWPHQGAAAARLGLLKAKAELLEQQVLECGFSRKALLSEG